jgi:acyl-CoA synthetase (AMP-forming)/AMP-acid ligase II
MAKPTHITDYLAQNATKYAHKPAIVTDERTLTWAELHQEVSGAAASVHTQLGRATEQQVVALLLPNTWECVVAYLAIVHAGHIAMPLDVHYRPPEIEAVLDAIPPALIITNDTFSERFMNPAAPLLNVSTFSVQLASSWRPLRLPASEQIASLMFTSGTTGKPKAAPYTHANHLWNIELSTKIWNWNPSDTLLISLPLSHWHGIVMGVSGAVRHGNTLYLRQHFEVEDTLRWLASGKISIFQHVSLVYVKLAQFEGYADYDLSKVRLCTSASSALPPAAWQEFKDHYGIEILECYGSAEAGRIASNTLKERQAGTPGRVIDGVELKISSEGEVEVKTPGLFPGYYHNEEATRASFTADGWWVMGDLGELDADGRLHLKGRSQEKAKKLGYSVYPRDIEWAIMRHPGVSEAYVLSVQEEDNPSDRLVYFVVGSVTPEELAAYCRKQLPSYWRPDDIIKVEAIPRTRTGKSKLGELRAMWQEVSSATH